MSSDSSVSRSSSSSSHGGGGGGGTCGDVDGVVIGDIAGPIDAEFELQTRYDPETTVLHYLLLSQGIAIPPHLVDPATGGVLTDPVSLLRGPSMRVYDASWLQRNGGGGGGVVPRIDVRRRVAAYLARVGDVLSAHVGSVLAYLDGCHPTIRVVFNAVSDGFTAAALREQWAAIRSLNATLRSEEARRRWRDALRLLRHRAASRRAFRLRCEAAERAGLALRDCYRESGSGVSVAAAAAAAAAREEDGSSGRRRRRRHHRRTQHAHAPSPRQHVRRIAGPCNLPRARPCGGDGGDLSSEGESDRCLGVSPFRSLFCRSLRAQRGALLRRREETRVFVTERPQPQPQPPAPPPPAAAASPPPVHAASLSSATAFSSSPPTGGREDTSLAADRGVGSVPSSPSEAALCYRDFARRLLPPPPPPPPLQPKAAAAPFPQCYVPASLRLRRMHEEGPACYGAVGVVVGGGGGDSGGSRGYDAADSSGTGGGGGGGGGTFSACSPAAAAAPAAASAEGGAEAEAATADKLVLLRQELPRLRRVRSYLRPRRAQRLPKPPPVAPPLPRKYRHGHAVQATVSAC